MKNRKEKLMANVNRYNFFTIHEARRITIRYILIDYLSRQIHGLLRGDDIINSPYMEFLLLEL